MGVRTRCVYGTIIVLLLGIPRVWAVPDTTLTVAPSCTAGTTISCSDETSRNSSISTAYNAHSHTDIASTSSSTFTGKSIALATTSPSIALTPTNGVAAGLHTELSGASATNLRLVNGTRTMLEEWPGGLIIGGSTSAAWDAGVTIKSTVTGDKALNLPLASVSFNELSSTALPAFNKVDRTAGDVTTTSTSMVAFTGASITITSQGSPALVGFTASCYNSVGTNRNDYNVAVDGILDQAGNGVSISDETGSTTHNCSFVYQTSTLAPGSHTLSLLWQVSAGTGTTRCSGNYKCTFWTLTL